MMIDFFHLGQGPRPDLLEKELNMRVAIQKRVSADTAKPLEKTSVHSPKDKTVIKADHKDVAAMILALFQVLLPWIVGGIAIFFLVIFLITKI
jgi:hypothetical protein